jgi:hypothetical protein
MKDAGLPEETRNNVLRHYRDILSVEEPDMRREVQKMDPGRRRR